MGKDFAPFAGKIPPLVARARQSGAMSGENLVRDLLELLIVIAIGGMLVSAVQRLRRGEIRAFVCPSCGRPTTRANGICKHCGADLES
jgi:hypothetical protein